MIEEVGAASGGKVVRYRGRLLASAVDPVREAREWLQRRLTLLNRVKTVFVLGAGAGYHIAELIRETRAAILVIEQSAELAAWVQAAHAFPSDRVQFVHAQSAKELRASESVRAGVAGSFLVLQHAPTAATAPDFYRECRNQLLGRDWGGLSWQWQLQNLGPLDAQPKIHAAEQPLSIYDLDQSELVQNSSERERMLLKALRELVK